MKFLRQFAARIVGQSIRIFARAITAVRADWQGIEPVPRQRVYFANHTSNADMPMIWSVLPPAMRRTVRPVAAADYWLKNKLRAFVGPEVFNCVLVDRRPEVKDKPMDKIIAALDEGSSLIIFQLDRDYAQRRSDPPAPDLHRHFWCTTACQRRREQR